MKTIIYTCDNCGLESDVVLAGTLTVITKNGIIDHYRHYCKPCVDKLPKLK